MEQIKIHVDIENGSRYCIWETKENLPLDIPKHLWVIHPEGVPVLVSSTEWSLASPIPVEASSQAAARAWWVLVITWWGPPWSLGSRRAGPHSRYQIALSKGGATHIKVAGGRKKGCKYWKHLLIWGRIRYTLEEEPEEKKRESVLFMKECLEWPKYGEKKSVLNTKLSKSEQPNLFPDENKPSNNYFWSIRRPTGWTLFLQINLFIFCLVRMWQFVKDRTVQSQQNSFVA